MLIVSQLFLLHLQSVPIITNHPLLSWNDSNFIANDPDSRQIVSSRLVRPQFVSDSATWRIVRHTVRLPDCLHLFSSHRIVSNSSQKMLLPLPLVSRLNSMPQCVVPNAENTRHESKGILSSCPFHSVGAVNSYNNLTPRCLVLR